MAGSELFGVVRVCVCMYERVGDSSCMRRRRAGLVAPSVSESGCDEGCKLRLRCPPPPEFISQFTISTTLTTLAGAVLFLAPFAPFVKCLCRDDLPCCDSRVIVRWLA